MAAGLGPLDGVGVELVLAGLEAHDLVEEVLLPEEDAGAVGAAAGEGPVGAHGDGEGVGGEAVVVVPGEGVAQGAGPDGGVVAAPEAVVALADELEVGDLALHGDGGGAAPRGEGAGVEGEGVAGDGPEDQGAVVFREGGPGDVQGLVGGEGGLQVLAGEGEGALGEGGGGGGDGRPQIAEGFLGGVVVLFVGPEDDFGVDGGHLLLPGGDGTHRLAVVEEGGAVHHAELAPAEEGGGAVPGPGLGPGGALGEGGELEGGEVEALGELGVAAAPAVADPAEGDGLPGGLAAAVGQRWKEHGPPSFQEKTWTKPWRGFPGKRRRNQAAKAWLASLKRLMVLL